MGEMHDVHDVNERNGHCGEMSLMNKVLSTPLACRGHTIVGSAANACLVWSPDVTYQGTANIINLCWYWWRKKPNNERERLCKKTRNEDGIVFQRKKRTHSYELVSQDCASPCRLLYHFSKGNTGILLRDGGKKMVREEREGLVIQPLSVFSTAEEQGGLISALVWFV